jgi:hypothetical protein
MARNLKFLGIALVAIFAMSAVAASAQQGKLTSDGSFTLKAEQTGPETWNSLTAFGLGTQCPGSTLTGHKYNVTPHATIPSGETTITFTPNYVNCVTIVGASRFPSTIDMNGCDYVAHLQSTSPVGNKEGTYGATTDIICPIGREITVTVWTNATNHANNTTPMCVLHINEQKGLSGIHARDSGISDITIDGSAEGIHVAKTKTTHAVLCPSASTVFGSIDIDVTVRGYGTEGSLTSVSISE